MERDAHNDNEELSFTRIGLVAARVIDRLEPHEKQDEESAEDRRGSKQNEQTAERHSEYVEQRLRDLSAFERKARGNQKRR